MGKWYFMELHLTSLRAFLPLSLSLSQVSTESAGEVPVLDSFFHPCLLLHLVERTTRLDAVFVCMTNLILEVVGGKKGRL